MLENADCGAFKPDNGGRLSEGGAEKCPTLGRTHFPDAPKISLFILTYSSFDISPWRLKLSTMLWIYQRGILTN